MFVKAIASAVLLGIIGLLVGPFALAPILLPAFAPDPAMECGLWVIVPFAVGGGLGAVGGVCLGFLLGLVT